MALDLTSWPRRAYVELFLSGSWQPVGQHVMQSPDITIQRGIPDQSDVSPPAICTFTLNDSSDKGNGAYNPYNPLGAYYGQLTRNVPIRTGLRVGEDDFARTVGSGWGTSLANGAWSAFTSGGTVATSVASGAGKHTITSTNATALTYISDVAIRDVEVAISATITSVSDVTGGGIGFGEIVLRGQSTSVYYLCNVEVSTAEVVTLKILKINGGTTTLGTVVLPTAYTGQQWRIKAQAEGRTIRLKAWPAASSEPLDWQLIKVDPSPLTAGFVGVLSARLTGNTNATPVVVSYDDLALRLPRFEGETTRLVPDADSTMTMHTTAVRCADITQRLSQGKSPVVSPLRRSIVAQATDAQVVGYWPIEEQSYATSIASAVGGNPMQVLYGGLNANFGSDDTFPGSLPLPAIGTTEFRAAVPKHTTTGEYVINLLLRIPGGQDDTAIFVVEMLTSGSVGKWQIQLEQDGSLSVRAFDRTGIVLDDAANPVITDKAMTLTFDVEQNGSNVDYLVQWNELETPTVAHSLAGGSVSSQTLGTATQVGIIGGVPDAGFPGPDGAVVGHMYLSTTFSLLPMYKATPGYNGEYLYARMIRIATENGLLGIADLYDDLTADDTLGPQRPDTLINLMRECAATNHGLLFTPKGDRGLSYRRLESLYDPVPLVTLDHATGVFQPGFKPVNDDFSPRNDIKVDRRDGGSAEAIRLDGPNNANDPGTADGSVGLYDTTYQVNCQTDNQAAYSAGWLLSIGTVNAPRCPDIPVELSSNELRNSSILQGALLDVGPGDVIRLTNLTKWGIYDVADQMVVGYTERYNTTFRHIITYNAVPADPYFVGKLDDGAIRLDSGSSTGAATMTTTATSMSVSTSDANDLWITTATFPGDFPFDIIRTGERMTVTAITGASSPQTFTVTRSVNGVVKTHAAGEVVSLFDPYPIPR